MSRLGAVVSTAVIAAGVLAACGGSGSGSAEGDGILKYGYPMSVAGIHLDPAVSYNDNEMVYYKLIYGSLLRQAADGTYTPWMAEDVKVVDKKTVEITLREGMVFSDGAKFDAEAVRTSLLHMSKPTTPQAQGGLDPAMRVLDDIEVTGPLAVTVHLSAPMAGEFYAELAKRPGAIVSPDQIAEDPGSIDTKPIGAGPFVVSEHKAGQLLAVRKNPDYFDAAKVDLEGVDVINTPLGPQHANGLVSGTLDYSAYLPVDAVDALEARGEYRTTVVNGSNVYLNMCTGKAPFDNPKFRQAIQLGIDREKFSEVAFQGQAKPAYGLIPEDSVGFDPAIKDVVSYDPDRARELLEESGIGDSPVDIIYPTTISFGPQGEVLQSQLEDIGFNVNVTGERDSSATFIVPQRAGSLLYFYVGAPAYRQFFTYFGEGSLQALCGMDRPDVMKHVELAASLPPGEPASNAAYAAAAQVVADNAYLIPITTYPNVQGWNADRVTNDPTTDAQGNVDFDLLQMD